MQQKLQNFWYKINSVLMFIAYEDKQTYRINNLLTSMLMDEFSLYFRNHTC